MLSPRSAAPDTSRRRAAALVLGALLVATTVVVLSRYDDLGGIKLFGPNGLIEESMNDGNSEEQQQSSACAALRATATASGNISSRLDALSLCRGECASFACLRAAHQQPRGKARFNFPHFHILGWPKCATTSLYRHLESHPEIQPPAYKEPHFWNNFCLTDPLHCPPDKENFYLRRQLNVDQGADAGLQKAALDGSTHYAEEGAVLAPALRKQMPWLKLVMSLREPISRRVSYLVHSMERDGWGEGMPECMKRKDVYDCLRVELAQFNYSTPLQAWLEQFPPEQLFIIQYEKFVSDKYEGPTLAAVKQFIGVDPALPSIAMRQANHRKDKYEEGWPILKWQYEHLLELVRPDAKRVLELLEQHSPMGFGRTDWMSYWEKAWRDTLDTCDENDTCYIHPT